VKVLVNAGPWLSVPPPGYGGIENVVDAVWPSAGKVAKVRGC
jgi:hypothetical protein